MYLPWEGALCTTAFSFLGLATLTALSKILVPRMRPLWTCF